MILTRTLGYARATNEQCNGFRSFRDALTVRAPQRSYSQILSTIVVKGKAAQQRRRRLPRTHASVTTSRRMRTDAFVEHKLQPGHCDTSNAFTGIRQRWSG